MMQLRAGLVFITIALAAAAADDERVVVAVPNDGNKRRRIQGTSYYYFNVRLYWKEGYTWQESTSEKFWCMKCQSSGCNKGSGIKIAKCDRDDWRQHFFFDDGRIRTRRNLDVCLERSGRSIIFKGCDGSDDQLWDNLSEDGPFRLQIPGNDSKCASQHHHPKDGEKIYMTSCKLCRDNDVGKWVVY
jgi:hypothetical protein